MSDEFSRTRLLLGEEAMDLLAHSTVAVFGVGGVGSHCIEALARGGVGRLVLVDNDRVSITNINRQSIAYHSTAGQYKTLVMKERIRDINPKAQVLTYEAFLLPDNIKTVLESVPGSIDYMVDAIDTVTAKLSLVQYASQKNIPLISSMGTGNKLHPELFEITDITKTSVCPLCRVIRRELKKRDIPHLKVLYSREEPRKPAVSSGSSAKRAIPGSVSFVPPVAGLLLAGEVLRTLAKVND